MRLDVTKDLTEETNYVADDLVDVIIKYCDNILRIFGFANPYLPFMFWLKSKAIDIKDRKSIFITGTNSNTARLLFVRKYIPYFLT
jgi:hypothetical protein